MNWPRRFATNNAVEVRTVMDKNVDIYRQVWVGWLMWFVKRQ
jgi:hypothetical protein